MLSTLSARIGLSEYPRPGSEPGLLYSTKGDSPIGIPCLYSAKEVTLDGRELLPQQYGV